ncbi:MAG: site-2 protease family protein [Pseudomonadota bacterium]
MVVTILFLGAILLLIWLLLAAPLGCRTLSNQITVRARREDVWSALFPFGQSFDWDKGVTHVVRHSGLAGTMVTTQDDRDGKPIRRDFVIDRLQPYDCFSLQYTKDSALDDAFWRDFVRTVHLSQAATDLETTIKINETDRYRGIAFLVFRWFARRRSLRKLKLWLKTGEYRPGGVFENPYVQATVAIGSTVLLWPLFGLTQSGLIMSSVLTAVVALHEYGHVLAFRLMGHKTARMIFVPLLGGIAIGSRPYGRHYEIAFSALMGAGFSVFASALVLTALGLAPPLHAEIEFALWFFVFVAGAFNAANLLPIYRFDGGQLLRQVFRTPLQLGVATVILAWVFVLLSLYAGMPYEYVLAIIGVALSLSWLTNRSGVKPSRPLTPMTGYERVAISSAAIGTITFHAFAIQIALEKLV